MQIVISDDDAVCRRMVETTLNRWGFDVLATRDGVEASTALLANERPSLAILDWTMPGMDGLQVVRQVRQHRPLHELFILMLTSRATKAELAEALDAGANDYITKPFDKGELKARLQVGERMVGGRDNTTSPLSAPELSCLMESCTSDNFGSLQSRSTIRGLEKEGYITPMFDPHSMQFHFGIAAPMLRAWEEDGTLEKVVLDRVQLCPQCHAVPTFRFGCPCCGSGRVLNDRLIHHFACAHVAAVEGFEHEEELVCPKCLVRSLVVGADFEYLNGPYRCLDCEWTAVELEHIGHCLNCGYRFPAPQSFVQDLVGYHGRRLEDQKTSSPRELLEGLA